MRFRREQSPRSTQLFVVLFHFPRFPFGEGVCFCFGVLLLFFISAFGGNKKKVVTRKSGEGTLEQEIKRIQISPINGDEPARRSAPSFLGEHFERKRQ